MDHDVNKIILDTVLDTNTRVIRLETESLNLDRRVSKIERRWWQAVVGIVVGLSSLLAAGAASFVDYFTHK